MEYEAHMTKNLVTGLAQRFSHMQEARQSYEPAWRDLADHFLPTRYKDTSKSPHAWRTMPMLNDTLVDSTGILAMRTLAAGLQGGMTSPARPWFQLSLEDADLAAHSAVRDWLMLVSRRMRKIFAHSNFYNAVHTLYGELGTFGTAFMLQLADEEHGFRFVPFCAGEYCLDINAAQRVDVVFRRFHMTARQLLMQFGEDRVPQHIRHMADKSGAGNVHDDAHTVVHAIYPRKHHHKHKECASHMPFASVYYLEGHSGKGMGHVLSESGFQEFPGYGVRWDVAGNEVYGRSPAMDVLPDCRMLQQMGITTLKAIHKAVDPPTAVSASLKSVGLDLTPGGVNYVEAAPGQSPQAATPILDIRPDITAARKATEAVQKQIQQGLYNDLFRQLLDSNRSQVTAKEVAVREEEKLILLGPVLERLHCELYTPLIERTYNLMQRFHMLPPRPQELGEAHLKIEFVSLLAQAQKMVCTGAVERLVSFVGNLTPLQKDVHDTIDTDKAVEEYADYLGISPGIVRAPAARQQLRQARADAEHAVQQQKAQQEQQEQIMDTLKTLTGMVKDMGDVSMDKNSLMGNVAGALTVSPNIL